MLADNYLKMKVLCELYYSNENIKVSELNRKSCNLLLSKISEITPDEIEAWCNLATILTNNIKDEQEIL